MSFLLTLSRLIDALTERIGKRAMWFILATTMISAGNAIVRKLFDTSSNAFLEIQWYLFAAVFMLGSGYAFLRNAHVRIDFVSSRFSDRARNWVDIVGILVFVLPLCYMMVVLGWLLFGEALDRWTLLGAAIILAANAYIAHREAVLSRKAATQSPSAAAKPVE